MGNSAWRQRCEPDSLFKRICFKNPEAGNRKVSLQVRTTFGLDAASLRISNLHWHASDTNHCALADKFRVVGVGSVSNRVWRSIITRLVAITDRNELGHALLRVRA